jgi:hypothetical protein
VKKPLVDQGFKKTIVAHGAQVGIDVEIVERNPADSGFVPQPKRWIVEQTNGTLMLHRRLVRGVDRRQAAAELARTTGYDRRTEPGPGSGLRPTVRAGAQRRTAVPAGPAGAAATVRQTAPAQRARQAAPAGPDAGSAVEPYESSRPVAVE